MSTLRRRFFIGLLLGCIAVLLLRLGLDRHYREEENYSLIEEGLYMGGRVQNPPPGTKAVLNLDETEDSYRCDVHLWEPIRDSAPAPSIDWLRRQVDFVVVTSHWGVPYERQPATDVRERARCAIDLGADAVVGHHPHIIQPCEVYRGRPIFYSVGNFAFGSGNSKAEGLLVGFRNEAKRLTVEVYPLYVKNRDPRVRYQPKVLRGGSARRVLQKLIEPGGVQPGELEWDGPRAVLHLPRRT